MSDLHIDNGCDKAKLLGYEGLCEDCIFTECLEIPGIYEKERIKERSRIIESDLENGLTTKEIARKYGVSTRTIQRSKRKARTR